MLYLLLLALACILLYRGKALLAWTVPCALGLLIWGWKSGWASPFWMLFLGLFAVLVVGLAVAPIRRLLVSPHVLRALAPIFPRMSETERVALDAGTVWWDGELFSGAPHWQRLLEFQPQKLSDREQAFLDGPVEELCRMVDDYEVQKAGDISKEAWEHIKSERFMGMIIPEEYGGLGFSAIAHSAVVAKISSRCVTAAVTTMVPNSLGPAELLLHYGTQEQKDHYLPRLASGEEVPCFALTEPNAGSDAGSMQSTGVICRGTWKGEEVVGIRLNWDKRYITLSTVATLLGLAFKLYDPDGLIGDQEDLGITCALVPADVKGVQIGERHDPMGVPFMNGPTHGKDVFVPLDAIIGGEKMAGQGWRMLMECLSAGRAISLPALACGAAELCTRTAGAYASVREQFGMAIGRFEGIEESLAEIGGRTYMLDAARRLTAGAVDAGQKPSVVSAIMKRYSTEDMRTIVNHAMDIQGGAGLVRGPRNVLARAYQAVPIGITVEGANILTRCMIIFGQGAIRCHPYAREEMEAAAARDVKRFDKAFFGHVGFIARNAVRSLLLGLTGSRIAAAPASSSTARYFQQLSRFSAAFAFASDMAMGTLGGALKRKEKLSGRLADALAWMYLASATLKRFEDDGRPAEEEPFMRWSVETALYEVQVALGGLIDNLPNRWAAGLLRVCAFPLGRGLHRPNDRIGSKVARAMLDGAKPREALTRDIFVPAEDDMGLGRLERALRLAVAAAPARKKLREAVKAKSLPRASEKELLPKAVELSILSDLERKQVEEAAEAREEAVRVDAFDAKHYLAMTG